MTDLSAFMPVIVMIGFFTIIIIGLAINLRAFYKKAKPGEVLIINTLEKDPKIVRNGAVVFPVIHCASSVNLNTQVIDVDESLFNKIADLYGVTLNSITVQVQDSQEGILRAHQRVDLSDHGANSKQQLKSILNQAIQEALGSVEGYDMFKKHLSTSLDKVGYELVVQVYAKSKQLQKTNFAQLLSRVTVIGGSFYES